MNAGITGHRDFDNDELVVWIKSSLAKIAKEYHVDHGYTCLAPGSDEFFSEILRKNHIDYTLIIPCVDYESTFEESSLAEYLRSKAQASEVIPLEFEEPTEIAFYAAGKLVVDKSDLVIAVWDGKEAKGLGGTADIVEYSITQNKFVLHLDVTDRIIRKLN